MDQQCHANHRLIWQRRAEHYGGATVSNTTGTIGSASGAIGLVTVDGTGSKWTNSNGLTIGTPDGTGTGTLVIAGGSTVVATSVRVNYKSLLEIDVTDGTLLNVGSGSGLVTGVGTITITAGAGTSPGTYTPISAAPYYNSLVYPIGGTWSPFSGVFTVPQIQTGTSRTPLPAGLRRPDQRFHNRLAARCRLRLASGALGRRYA